MLSISQRELSKEMTDGYPPRQYGAFQFGIYEGLPSHPILNCPSICVIAPNRGVLTTLLDGMFNNRLPLVTTDPNKLEEQAKQVLKTESYNYVAGGAGERATMDANRLAFRQWKLVPRMMRVTERDLRVELFGEIYSTFLSIFVYDKPCY